MDYVIITKIIKSKKRYYWVDWLRLGRLLSFKKNRSYYNSKVTFPIRLSINRKKKNDLQSRLVHDFGGLVHHVEKYQPSCRKCFIILEKTPQKRG